MHFEPTPLEGAWLIRAEPVEDERGYFARIWCAREFKARGLDVSIVQCSVSFTRRRGTVRGMHFQKAPYGECKLVRCSRGALYDVIIDLRPASLTYKKWFAVQLSEDDHLALFVPKGFAHGFQTLVDEVEVFYQMSEFYHPECSAGVRWDDPSFAIEWPIPPTVISKKDQSWPDFEPRVF